MNGTESISTTINSFELDGENTIELEKPITIYFQKSQVIARYTISYLQDYNYKPYETVITSDVFSCSDGAYDDDPNCGWQYDSSGAKIHNSQGFCCECGFWEILGISTSDYNRAKDCGSFNFGTGSATAHCLRWTDLWYSAYQIIKSQLYYVITVYIYEEGNSEPISTLTLDPTNAIANDENLGCVVKLIGDFVPSEEAPELNHLYLFIPSSPSTNTLVQEGTTAWMLINPSEVTASGDDCNKIGVSYYAFNTQSDKCEQEVGTCLKNQIYHLYNSDLKLIKAGETPEYLLKAYVNFQINFIG